MIAPELENGDIGQYVENRPAIYGNAVLTLIKLKRQIKPEVPKSRGSPQEALWRQEF